MTSITVILASRADAEEEEGLEEEEEEEGRDLEIEMVGRWFVLHLGHIHQTPLLFSHSETSSVQSGFEDAGETDGTPIPP